mgnify:CR=1 FL=1
MEAYFGPISPILLLAMIAGLVEFAKKFGLQGNGLLILSMVLGVGFGVLFQVMEMYPGVFTVWARVVIYGITFGLSASGLYDVGKRLAGAVGAAIALAKPK